MTTMLLRNIPEGVKEIVKKVQDKEKKSRNTKQYSFGRAVCKIIKEWENNCNSND